MTREEIIEMVDLALKKGKIENLYLDVQPNDNRPCGLFSETEADIIAEEMKSDNFSVNGKGHFLSNIYHLSLHKKGTYITLKYSPTVDDKISKLEKQMAELQAQKEQLGEKEEIC